MRSLRPSRIHDDFTTVKEYEQDCIARDQANEWVASRFELVGTGSAVIPIVGRRVSPGGAVDPVIASSPEEIRFASGAVEHRLEKTVAFPNGAHIYFTDGVRFVAPSGRRGWQIVAKRKMHWGYGKRRPPTASRIEPIGEQPPHVFSEYSCPK